MRECDPNLGRGLLGRGLLGSGQFKVAVFKGYKPGIEIYKYFTIHFNG